ncbi:uncharacterized protein LOC108956159 isoform X1 [Eucalyptus grandis]|uniref:uncharacterized protein LOC108956159 isoform X1 n=1 Tax=Eucalyptus grandis TaxID=71139 RepID=UPI00192EE681|nr:uncharacterized protein LOC108956159 isoform X1 [Eucalyptus grandis]XP_039160726.1 uncharacterized protein LOC108956159 isoform X1 [Eucalyptus grandis]
MYELLKEVKQKIPSIEAVSSRAITSDYQRLLVESVCSWLGLVSLAYLWKQDQSMLLQEKVLLGTGGMIFPAWLLLYGEFRRTCLHMQNRCLRGYAAFSSFFQNETDLHALLWKFHLLQRHSPVVLRTGSYEPFNKKWNNAYLVCSLLEGLARYN